MFQITDKKLVEVAMAFSKSTGKHFLPSDLRGVICADWNEGEEHQEWLDEAAPEEIAEWLEPMFE